MTCQPLQAGQIMGAPAPGVDDTLHPMQACFYITVLKSHQVRNCRRQGHITQESCFPDDTFYLCQEKSYILALSTVITGWSLKCDPRHGGNLCTAPCPFATQPHKLQ